MARRVSFREILGYVGTLLLTALSVVIALAWNNAIDAYFRSAIHVDENSVRGRLLYAVLATALGTVAAFVIMWVTGSDGKSRLF